jgi:hypothetical protein
MFPLLLGIGLDEGVSIESMEGWMVVYSSKDGHDACDWMRIEGAIRGRSASFTPRFDSPNPLAGLCSWITEVRLRGTRIVGEYPLHQFPVPVHTPAWDEGHGRAWWIFGIFQILGISLIEYPSP